MTESWLQSYFERIGFTGEARRNIETLRELHRLHPAHIAYETMDLLMGRIPELSDRALVSKLVEGRRGGHCIEQNMLFKWVLNTIGFRVEAMMCRSRFGWRPDQTPPRGHMSLRAFVGGKVFLVDVGFGSWMLTAPIDMGVMEAQPTAFEPVRLVAVGDELRLEAMLGGGWRPIYDVLPHAQQDGDFDAIHWHAGTHPDSVYRRRLMVSIAGAVDRCALRDNVLTIRKPDGAYAQRTLSPRELERCLAETFGLAVEARWRPVLEAIVAGARLDAATSAPHASKLAPAPAC